MLHIDGVGLNTHSRELYKNYAGGINLDLMGTIFCIAFKQIDRLVLAP